eukprot:1613508-Rhodomonas_salina.2
MRAGRGRFQGGGCDVQRPPSLLRPPLDARMEAAPQHFLGGNEFHQRSEVALKGTSLPAVRY